MLQIRKVLLEWLPFILCVQRPRSKIRDTKETTESAAGDTCCPTAVAGVEKQVTHTMSALDLQARSCSLLANVLDLDDHSLTNVRSFSNSTLPEMTLRHNGHFGRHLSNKAVLLNKHP